MTESNDISKALTNLSEGKFSFQMVECINLYIRAQQNELSELRLFRDKAAVELAQREYEIYRLEKTLKSANAKIFALIKSNEILEQSIQMTKRSVVKFKDEGVPKLINLYHECIPHILNALTFSKTEMLNFIKIAEPLAHQWWSSAQTRRKELLEQVRKISAQLSTKDEH